MPSYSGLWDRQYGEAYSALAANGNTSEYNHRDMMRIAKEMRSARPGRILGALLNAAIGAAAGATATSTYTRKRASQHYVDGAYAGGGFTTVETVTDLNRATTANDITLLKTLTTQSFGPTVNSGYPVDKSGNGGGGKLIPSGNYGF